MVVADCDDDNEENDDQKRNYDHEMEEEKVLAVSATYRLHWRHHAMCSGAAAHCESTDDESMSETSPMSHVYQWWRTSVC